MTGRTPFAYVVSISGTKVTLNLQDVHRGHYASHVDGVSVVTEVGALFGVDDGHRLQIMRVQSLSFAEPKEAHRAGVGTTSPSASPLRYLEAAAIGAIDRKDACLVFTPDSLLSPALGAAAFPLTRDELKSILEVSPSSEKRVVLGEDIRSGANLRVSFQDLLSRHVAVLGATGHGKSCLTAAILQQLLKLPRPRIIVFDINGEYETALRSHVTPPSIMEYTTIGGRCRPYKIPYIALGRHGLSRLLLPSEKTQRPALNFAIENLQSVEWFKQQEGVGLTCPDLRSAILFDDCRPNPCKEAKEAIDLLRSGKAPLAEQWPNMRALSCLVAESHSLQRGRYNALERNGHHYSNVAPLVNRIQRYCEDPQFTAVVDVDGRPPAEGNTLDWQNESSSLVKRIFGDLDSTWKLHIVNLRHIAHDLLPVILGALLELLAFERFQLGQEASYPTLLVLEEAHHYLRKLTTDDEDAHSAPAYERLAKEGRKFGISLWVSTQRPSELSPTVLAQCGTWAAFRLTAGRDLEAIKSAGEWFDRQELDRIAGLPRRQAVIFGSSVAIPIRVIAPEAHPTPKSSDPDFSAWTETADATSHRQDDQTVNETADGDQPSSLEDDDIPF